MSSRQKVISLYRSLLRESNKFSAYNYRLYFLRRVKDEFRENKNVTDPKAIENFCVRAANDLEVIKRQVVVGNLYRTNPLIIEHSNP